MANRISINNLVQAIEPDKSIVEDLEVLAFENEEQLDFYSVWHESLFDKRRELNAESERERTIIRKEIARKTSQYALGCYSTNEALQPSTSRRPTIKARTNPTVAPARNPQPSLAAAAAAVSKVSPPKSAKSSSRSRSGQRSGQRASRQTIVSPIRPPLPTKPDLDNGLSIINSEYFKTFGVGTCMIKYKLTKMYNKFRGRQKRRNLVLDRQKAAKLEAALSKSYLNHWGAYTALQAVYVPEVNSNNLSTIAIRDNPKFITIAQPQHDGLTTGAPATIASPKASKSKKVSPKKQQQQLQQDEQLLQQQQPGVGPSPMHLVCYDSNDLITYSNRINPQQVAAYRARSHLLPSSANSKRSSAASYDVYEIMEVLVNTTKTNVTITRNANKPAPKGGHSIYSHSINMNTPGIASTQLHLQARAYLDSVSKFYAEEARMLAIEEEKLISEPSIEEQIAKYIKIQ